MKFSRFMLGFMSRNVCFPLHESQRKMQGCFGEYYFQSKKLIRIFVFLPVFEFDQSWWISQFTVYKFPLIRIKGSILWLCTQTHDISKQQEKLKNHFVEVTGEAIIPNMETIENSINFNITVMISFWPLYFKFFLRLYVILKSMQS